MLVVQFCFSVSFSAPYYSSNIFENIFEGEPDQQLSQKYSVNS